MFINKMKQIINSITVLTILFQFVFTGFAAAKLYQFFGLVGGSWYNNLYQTEPGWFWVVWVGSRAFYFLGLYFINDWLANYLWEKGWYWFSPKTPKPVYTNHIDASEEYMDKSWMVILMISILIIASILGDALITVLTGIPAPYFLE